MKKNLKLITLIFLFASCKKTEVSGYIYSKNNIPLPSQDVKIYFHIGSTEGLEGSSAVTDAKGHYYIKFRSKRDRAYTVKCENDSSNDWQPINEKQTNQIDLYLK
jgi:hypothetical protein